MTTLGDRRPTVHLLLVRHGETESNRRQRYAGRNHEPLTQEGRRQSELAGGQLRDRAVQRILCGPLPRAVQTAEIIGAALGLEPERDADLDEMMLGPWTGLTESEVARRFPEEFALWQQRPAELRLPGRETLADVLARGLRCVGRLAGEPGPVLLVTHVSMIRVLRLCAEGRSLNDYKQLDVPNCALFEVRVPLPTTRANALG